MMTGSIAAAMVMMVVSLISTLASNEYQSYQQEHLLEKQQLFNSEEAEKNREFLSEDERFKRMTVDLGFNPDLAAASIMGVSGSNGFAAQSPNAPQVPNLSGALGGLLGGMPSTILDALQQPATIENIQSETRRNNTESDWIPLSRKSQIDYWDAYAQEALSKIPVNSNLARLYGEQADWVAPLSQAECLEFRSRYFKEMEEAVLAYQQAITQGSLREMYQAYTEEAKSQVSLNEQLKEESENRERYYDNLSTSEFYKGLKEFYDVNLREKMAGLPLSDDMKFNLFVLRAVGNESEQKLADDLFQSVLNGCRDLSDMEYEVNYENRIEHLWGNFGMDVLGAVPNLMPNFYMPLSLPKSPSKPTRTRNGRKFTLGDSRYPSTTKGHASRGASPASKPRYDSYGNILPHYKDF